MSRSARRCYVDTTFGQIHVTEKGAGPAVLLMHWVPLSGRMYEAELPYFAKAGRRAIAVDLMGFGRSDRREGVWSVEQHADCMAEMLASLGARDVAVMGGHYGTPIAVEMARRGTGIRALVVDGGPMLSNEAFAALLAKARVGAGSGLHADGSHRNFLWDQAAHTYSIFAPQDFKVDNAHVHLLYRFIADYIESGMRADMSALQPYAFAEKIAAVTAPTLVLTSETEPLRACFEPMAAARGACATHEFPGDHPLHEPKRAGEFAHVVTQFLDLECHPCR